MNEHQSIAPSAGRMDRWKRDLYNLFWTHVPSRRIRSGRYRRMLADPGSGCFIGLSVRFLDPWKIHLSNRVVINGGCLLDARGGDIRIGDDTDIGLQSNLWTLGHDPHSPTHATKGGPITIEDHVWIATRVTILPGVTIGRGAVVAAGSIVSKDVAPLSMVAGVPAREIGTRDNPLTYKLNYHPRFR